MNYLKLDNCPLYNALRKRQRLFLYTYVFEAKTQSEAYKIAYNKQETDNTCYTNSNKLLSNTKIQKAYDELVKAYSNVTKEELYQKVKDITLNASKTSDRLRGLELLMRAEGYLSSDVTTQTAIFNNIDSKQLIEGLSKKRLDNTTGRGSKESANNRLKVVDKGQETAKTVDIQQN